MTDKFNGPLMVWYALTAFSDPDNNCPSVSDLTVVERDSLSHLFFLVFMICSVPPELLEIIGLYLSLENHLELVSVNRLFYHAYIKLLLRHVKMTSREHLDQFLNQSRNHCFVQHLQISAEINEDDIKQIAQSLSHLSSICFTMNNYRIDLLQSISSFDCLYSLALDSVPIDETVLTYLPPQLKRLSISLKRASGSDQLTTAGRNGLEHIHTLCPLIEHLSVAYDQGWQPVVKKQEMPNYEIEKLELIFLDRPGDMKSWFYYFGYNYPKLASLKIQCNGSHYYRNSLLFREESNRKAYSRFFQGCPLLSHLETQDITLTVEFFRQLRYQAIDFTRTFIQPSSSSIFLHECKSDWTDFSTITKLDICYVIDAEHHLPMETIGRKCKHLNQLVLRASTQFRKKTLWIGTILVSFPYLKYLGLIDLKLITNKNVLIRYANTLHPLEEIHFERCFVSDGFFDCVSARCLNLKHLSLIETRFEYPLEKAMIDLKQQKLLTVNIKCPRVSNLDQVIRLFHVHSKVKSEWYYMSQYRVRPSTLLEVAECFERTSDINALLLDTMLSQHPSSWKDLVMHNYLHTSHLFEGLQLPNALLAGYFEILCQSIGALRINDRDVF
ncbi:hypothetical protein EDC96DRAFT_600907 [Choanephora cucurbitarum]|nr:hypothetical protein EDC96DRAFT_600907 [Choanephora cucurbitarum]